MLKPTIRMTVMKVHIVDCKVDSTLLILERISSVLSTLQSTICTFITVILFVDDNIDIEESISGDAHRNLLHEALMPSDDNAIWESFLERVTSHQDVVKEDVQDIGKPSLWAVVVKVK